MFYPKIVDLYFSVQTAAYGKPLLSRPGHCVLFQLAGAKGNSGVELGVIVSVWRGIKAPKVYAGEVHVNSCPAFRAVALDLQSKDQNILIFVFVCFCRHHPCSPVLIFTKTVATAPYP